MGLKRYWNRNKARATSSKSMGCTPFWTAVSSSLRWLKYPFSLVFIGLYVACSDAPNFTDTPEIEFLDITQTKYPQGSSDTAVTQVTIGFSDGNGDLGNSADDDGNLNLFFVDLRDSFETNFRIPKVPDEGAGNGITGEIRVHLPASCCIFPTGQAPCTPSQEFPTDTLLYEVYLIDRAGLTSNRITLPPIVLLCE